MIKYGERSLENRVEKLITMFGNKNGFQRIEGGNCVSNSQEIKEEDEQKL